jgi:DNA modification methylase
MTDPLRIGDAEIYTGDCLSVMRGLPSESVHMCVTSPPYWSLRDYGCSGQMGLERTPEEYVAKATSSAQGQRHD